MPLDNTARKGNIVVAKAPKARRLKIPAMTAEELAAAMKPGGVEPIRITRPKLKVAAIKIVGISPYCQHAFSEKQREQMEETQRQGQQARGKRKRDPKDFLAAFENAKHVSKQGWIGIPAPAFRDACIDACRLVGYKMTHAKLSIFVEADGIDKNDGTPLVKIIGEPRIHKGFVRNANGVADIRWRPFWEEWSAVVRIEWDEDQFSAHDIANLMLRAGKQVGIGEGRPNSPNSNGLGWGRFELAEG